MEQGKITLKELLERIGSDKTITYTNTITYKSPFGKEITKGGTYLLWKPGHKDTEIYFKFKNGIVTVGFCKETLEKLKEWAEPLSAYIYGDVGEEY